MDPMPEPFGLKGLGSKILVFRLLFRAQGFGVQGFRVSGLRQGVRLIGTCDG